MAAQTVPAVKKAPHLMRSSAGQTGTGLGGSVTTRRLRDNTPRDPYVKLRPKKSAAEAALSLAPDRRSYAAPPTAPCL